MNKKNSISKIVLASNNNKKLHELNLLLNDLNIEVITQGELSIQDIEETGATFAQNAILKAQNACKHSKLPSISDDSGLIVDALNGEPGIYSARYYKLDNFNSISHFNNIKDEDLTNDQKNINKLLTKLEMLEKSYSDNSNVFNTKARFVSSIAFINPKLDLNPLIFEGYWEGQILKKPIGENGFGYDPVFYIPELGKSAAELSVLEKLKLSHRSKALKLFKEYLAS